MEQTFHVMSDSVNATYDGILGHDFLIKNEALIDYKNHQIIINDFPIKVRVEAQKIKVPPRQESITRVHIDIS